MGRIGRLVDAAIGLIEDMVDRIGRSDRDSEAEFLARSLGHAHLRMVEFVARNAELEDENERLRSELRELRLMLDTELDT